MNAYCQLTVIAACEQVEEVTTLMQQKGALAVTMTDGGEEDCYDLAFPSEPKWRMQKISGLFNAHIVSQQFGHQLISQISGVNSFKLHSIADQNWQQSSLHYSHPIKISAGFWVCPSWCKPVDDEAINLILDPGLAFGTGTHATTQLCLQWLVQSELSGKRIIDYGCGSGILAIAAILLGANYATGVDIDSSAIKVATENAVCNKVTSQCLFTQGEEEAGQGADIVIANILANTLIDLAPRLMRLTDAQGHIILSGIKQGQESQVSEAFQSEFSFSAQYNEHWVVLIGTRQ